MPPLLLVLLLKALLRLRLVREGRETNGPRMITPATQNVQYLSRLQPFCNSESFITAVLSRVLRMLEIYTEIWEQNYSGLLTATWDRCYTVVLLLSFLWCARTATGSAVLL